MIQSHKHTYGPTKYSWAIENRLYEISNVKLRKTIQKKLSSMYQEFNIYSKCIEYIPLNKEINARVFFKYALYNEFHNRVMKNKHFAIVDLGIRENFIKVLKAKLKEI